MKRKGTEIYSIFGQCEAVAAEIMIEKGEITRIEPQHIPESAAFNEAGVAAQFAVVVPAEKVRRFNDLIRSIRA